MLAGRDKQYPNKMTCRECKHFKTENQKGFRVDRCDANGCITWSPSEKTYIPGGYCRDKEPRWNAG